MSNTFDINQHHKAATPLYAEYGRRLPHIQPITCADGFRFSVQASSYHYSEPRQDFAWPFTEFEVGFPSATEELLIPYASMTVDEDDNDVLSDVYAWVPAEVINAIVIKHGGLLT